MTQPYCSSREHLLEELAVADVLVKAQTRRWRTMVASTKSDWSMAYVDDREVERYLGSRFDLGIPADPAEATMAGGNRRDIAARVAATHLAGGSLRLEELVSRFGLGCRERQILLLALLPEVDSRYSRLYGYLLDDGSRWAPTIGLLDEMLAHHGQFAARGVLEPGCPLVDHELVVVADWSAADGPSRRAVRVDDRVTAFLLGSDAIDPRLRSTVRVLDDDHDVVELSDERAELVRGLAAEGGPRIVLSGGDPRAYLRTVAAIGRLIVRPVLVAGAGEVGETVGPCAVRLVVREARLRGAVLFWQDCEALFDRGRPVPAWDTLIHESARYPGLTVLDQAAPWDPEGRARSTRMVRWALPRAGAPERKALWQRLLSDLPGEAIPDTDVTAQRLAQTFELSRSQIEDAAASAEDLAFAERPGAATVTVDHILEACRRQTGRRLLTFTQRVPVPPRLDLDAEIVLPDEQKRQLYDLVDRIRLRNVLAERHPEDAWRRPSGVVCLFAGSSGTGKTLAAACVASALGKDLLKVDLPAVVSKWVGETEKNLQQVFAEAEDANAVMFFDEAESFFAKRGDVKGAQDRWAMMETDYLLQRIEGYTGAVILATNLRQQIDEAFLRRIHVIVDFPFPDARQRADLWRRALRRCHPSTRDDDLEREYGVMELAEQYSFSGAAIDNIVVNAEIAALSAGGERMQPGLIREATTAELRKSGRSMGI
ncbi:ATP-binding protein [Geodermatophilus sp. SYSU D00742]